MQVLFPDHDTSNAKVKDHMELVYRAHTIVLDRRDARAPLREIIDCRCYMGRSRNASVVHATVWVHSEGMWWSGSGNAGGYGYHKISAAIAGAFRSAGIQLDADIGGAGDYAVRAAYEAIVTTLGYREFIIVGG